MTARRPYPAPVGRTARRLEWQHLPPGLRDVIEERIGAPVAEARSQTGGFTPGCASVLVGDDGSCHFVKAASVKAQRLFAESYREEARKLVALPASVPAPRLLWTHDADDWVVLGIEHVDGRAPLRPWTTADLDASLAMLATTAAALTPPPSGWRSTTSQPSSPTGRAWDYALSTSCCRTARRPRRSPHGSPRSPAARRSCTPTSATTTS